MIASGAAAAPRAARSARCSGWAASFSTRRGCTGQIFAARRRRACGCPGRWSPSRWRWRWPPPWPPPGGPPARPPGPGRGGHVRAPGPARHRPAAGGARLPAARRGPILLAASGGWAQLGVNGGSLGWGAATAYGGLDTLLLIGALVATVLGALLSPRWSSRCRGPGRPGAGRRVPARSACLGRYRTRSPAALAAYPRHLRRRAHLRPDLRQLSNPLTYAGPNLAANQLIVYEPHSLFHGSSYTQTSPPTSAQQHAGGHRAEPATALHANFALELAAAGRPDQSPFTDSNPTTSRPRSGRRSAPAPCRARPRCCRTAATTPAPCTSPPRRSTRLRVTPGRSARTPTSSPRAPGARVPELELLGQGDMYQT